jgi:hypothetical protein
MKFTKHLFLHMVKLPNKACTPALRPANSSRGKPQAVGRRVETERINNGPNHLAQRNATRL